MSRISKLLLALLLAAMLVIPGTTALADEEDIIPLDQIRADSVNYKTAEIEYGNFARTESTAGTPYYPSRTRVIYEGLRALYVETLVEYGEFVEAGQELLKLEVEKDEAKIRELELKLERARASYEIGLRDRRREISIMNADRDKLGETYAVQKANMQIQRKEIELNRYIYSSEREISRQEADLQKLTEENAVTYVTAPISGRITEIKYYQPGDYVNPGDVLYRITNTNIFYVAADSDSFHFGTEASVTAHIRGKEYIIPGKVIMCTADVAGVNKSRTIISLEIPEDLSALVNTFSALDYATVRLSVSAETCSVDNVLLMPLGAKNNSGQEVYVNLLDSSNTLHRRPVIVAFSNRQYSWVLTGLNEGDIVVLD